VAVNADLGPAPPARAIGDDIANVVDYDFLQAGIVRLAPSRHYNLQKTLCEAVLDLCLSPSEVIEARVSTERSDVYPDCRVGYEAVRRRA
jgi:dihydroneopterin aldolase